MSKHWTATGKALAVTGNAKLKEFYVILSDLSRKICFPHHYIDSSLTLRMTESDANLKGRRPRIIERIKHPQADAN